MASPVACAGCGRSMAQGPGSLGAGKSICLPCRRAARANGTPLRACSVDGCGKAVHARGMCGKHYEANRVGKAARPSIACEYCEASFEPRDGKQRFCSTACRWSHRDAGRLRGHSKHREAIRIRDRDTCQLCGRRVDPTLTFPDRWSPTLDHIIPSSHGGSDDISNLRLAHLTCNASRQARPA